MGNSDWDLGPARYAGSDRGFRPALVREDRDRRRPFIAWLDTAASKFYDWRESDGEKLKAVLLILAERAKPRAEDRDNPRGVAAAPGSEPAAEKAKPVEILKWNMNSFRWAA